MQSRYQTRQRQVILDFFREHMNECFSAKSLRCALAGEHVSLGEATVYRTLDLLCKEGSLRRFQADQGGGATYQYATHSTDCQHHLHLKCQQCKQLFHLDCSHLHKLSEHLYDSHDFRVSQSDTILYGICKDCAEEDA